MRLNTALSALLIATMSLVSVPASAHADTAAQLRLAVVDQANVPLPSATVTVYTLDGNPGITVTTDEYGVASFPVMPVGMAQIHARTPGYAPYIEKTILQAGENTQTVKLAVRKAKK
jgi:hypothetical protein